MTCAHHAILCPAGSPHKPRFSNSNLSLARNWDRHEPQSEGAPLCETYDAFMVTGQQHKTACNREGILPMSIGFSGLDTPCCVHPVTIEVSPTHPLIQLAQGIPWQTFADMMLPDLKRTTAQGKWWLGRQLTRRIRLGACLLQRLYPVLMQWTHPSSRSMLTRTVSDGASLTDEESSHEHISTGDRFGQKRVAAPWCR